MDVLVRMRPSLGPSGWKACERMAMSQEEQQASKQARRKAPLERQRGEKYGVKIQKR